MKSVYHVLKDNKDNMAKKQVGESSIGLNDRLKWLDIWKQKNQPKVLQFLWRLAKGRGIDIDALCPMCRRLDEDNGHLFLKCKAVKQCW